MPDGRAAISTVLVHIPDESPRVGYACGMKQYHLEN